MSMALSAASVFILRTAIWTGGRQEGTPTPPCSSLARPVTRHGPSLVRGGEEQRRRNHQRASRGLYRREPLLAAIAGMHRPSLPLRSNALLGVIVGPLRSPVRPVRSLAAAPHGPQPRVGLAAPASCGNWAAPTWQPQATPIGRP